MRHVLPASTPLSLVEPAVSMSLSCVDCVEPAASVSLSALSFHSHQSIVNHCGPTAQALEVSSCGSWSTSAGALDVCCCTSSGGALEVSCFISDQLLDGALICQAGMRAKKYCGV